MLKAIRSIDILGYIHLLVSMWGETSLVRVDREIFVGKAQRRITRAIEITALALNLVCRWTRRSSVP
jgi:hypothetical protein